MPVKQTRARARRLGLLMMLGVTGGVSTVQAVGPMARPTVVVAAADGRRIAAQDGATIVIWDERGRQLARIASRAPYRGAFARERLVAVFDQGLGVRSGEGYNKLVLMRGAPPSISIHRLAISEDGAVVAALHPARGMAGSADAVTFFRASSGAKIGTLRVRAKRRLLDVSLARDGRWAVACGDRQRREAFCLLAHLSKRASSAGGWQSTSHRTVYSVHIDPAGKRVALALPNEVLLLSLPRLKPLLRREVAALKAHFPARLQRLLDPFPSAHLLRFSPRGDRLFSFHGTRVVGLGLWDAETLSAQAWLPRPKGMRGPIKQLHWGPRGGLWLLGSGGGLKVLRFRAEKARFVPQPALSPSP